jgi:hypothetical protein
MWGLAVAVGTPVTERSRAVPYMQLFRIRLLPRVITAKVCRIRFSACDTLARLWVRHVLCWPAFPLVSALLPRIRSGLLHLVAGFTATMAKSDFPRPCIIGYGSSPSRCGPGRQMACGQTRAPQVLVRVMWPSTPAGRQCSRRGIAHVALDHEDSLRSRD